MTINFESAVFWIFEIRLNWIKGLKGNVERLIFSFHLKFIYTNLSIFHWFCIFHLKLILWDTHVFLKRAESPKTPKKSPRSVSMVTGIKTCTTSSSIYVKNLSNFSVPLYDLLSWLTQPQTYLSWGESRMWNALIFDFLNPPHTPYIVYHRGMLWRRTCLYACLYPLIHVGVHERAWIYTVCPIKKVASLGSFMRCVP